MNEREELSQVISDEIGMTYDTLVDVILVAGWRKLPEPGSAEWGDMMNRATAAFRRTAGKAQGSTTYDCVQAALRAALGLDQP